MRYILLFLLFPAICAAQNFSIDGEKITWQKVYESELSQSDVVNLLGQNAILSRLSEDLSGNSEPVKLDCSESVPLYMNDKIQFFAHIAFKEGRYRVSVSNINLVPGSTAELFGVRTSEAPKPLEDFLLKNRDGSFRSNRIHTNARECIDTYLTDLFTFNKTEENDW